MKAVIFNSANDSWVRYEYPEKILYAYSLNEVLPVLYEAEKLSQQGYHCIGFVSYEASPAFDNKIQAHAYSKDLPLCCFGVYKDYQPFKFPQKIHKLPELSWQPSISVEEYKKKLHSIKKHLIQGDCYQVNFTYHLRTPFIGSPFNYFLSLIHNQKTTLGSYIEDENFAICSVSPELFFQLDNQQLTARPMKGTASRGRYYEEDEEQKQWLHNSEKNRAENTMIVDMIRNDMGKISSANNIQTTSLHHIEQYKTALQMTSTISTQTNQSIVDIFKAMFPCASITGAPKVKTTQIIKELEQGARGIYTGSIGCILPNRKARFNVAIRTVCIDKNNEIAEFGIGGGIVWDSKIEEEYQESLTKASILSAKNHKVELLETILWDKNNGYFLIEYHLQRLKKSAAFLLFKWDENKIEKTLQKFENYLQLNFNSPQIVRLIYSENGSIKIENKEIGKVKETLKISLSKRVINSYEWSFFHKTTNRSFYDKALELSTTQEADEVILCNEKGELCETTRHNIVLHLEGELYTPILDSGLLNGTFRQQLLKQGKIKERRLYIQDLHNAKEIYLINSVRKWIKAEFIPSKIKEKSTK